MTDVIVAFHFGLFFVPNSPKNQNLEKMKKKTPGDIIISILHMCNTCGRLLKYGARRTDRDRRTEKVTYKGGCPA